MPADAARPERAQPGGGTGYLVLYALAYAGGCIAYVPLLTLLLPLKVEALAPATKIATLSLTLLAGAVAASIANILFGALSDRSFARTGTRWRWIAGGLAATLLSYVLLGLCHTPTVLAGGIVIFQVAVNMMLAPTAALIADAVPDARKGLLGGLLAAGQPAGYLAGILVTSEAVHGEPAQLATTAGLIALLVLPFLAICAPQPSPRDTAPLARPERRLRRQELAVLWTARLAVQIAGLVLFAYLLFYFGSLSGGSGASVASGIARLNGVVMGASIVLAVLLGRTSDRLRRRKPFLVGTGVLMSAGLTTMAATHSWNWGVAGYALFALASAVFLVLHSVYAAELLPAPEHRGRDLGILNLTNTLPSIAGPAITAALVTGTSFTALLATLAGLTGFGTLLIAFALRSD